MKDPNLQDNLYWLFIQASFRSKKGLIKLAEEHDLTVVQLYTLCSMTPGQPMPMNEIAIALSCDPSNVTGIIDRLFSRHYIERQEKLHDRRVKMIALTLEGVKLRQKIIDGVMTHQPDSFKKLNDEQKTQLYNLLKLILDQPKKI